MDIQKELYQTDQYKRINFLNNLKNCLEIFNRNSNELLKLIEFGGNPEKARHLFYEKNYNLYQDFIFELSRHIHNYVASSYTLLKVTHNVMKYYKKDGEEKYFAEFKIKISELPNQPDYEIIYYLRQYYQHLNIPYLGSHYSVDNIKDKETISFNLNRNEILGYNKLSSLLRTYLEGLTQDEIPIREMIDKYNKLIYNFFDWVYDKLEIVLKNDIDFVNKKELEIKKYFTPSFIFARIKAIQGGSLMAPEDIFTTMVDENARLDIIRNNPKLEDKLSKLIELLEKDIPVSDKLKREIMSLATGEVLSKPLEIDL